MKKLIILFLCTSLVIAGTTGLKVQAQSFTELPSITVTANSNNVGAKVNKAFSRRFPKASNMKWYQLDKQFLVKFIEKDQENRALFSRNGYMVYHIRYGDEQHLPKDVRTLVKSNYFDQTITRVIQVNQDNRNIWVVSMEDPKDYIWVRVEDMGLEETQRIEKQI